MIAPAKTVSAFTRAIMKGIDGELNPRQLADLATIQGSSDYLKDVISDFKTAILLDAGKAKLKQEKFSIEKVVDRVTEQVDSILKSKGIKYKKDIEDGLLKVYADHGSVETIIEKLLENAVKFTEKGSVDIIAKKAEKSGYVQVTVKDTGAGIDSNKLENIFTAYSDGGANPMGEGGQGLSLYIVKGLVELHGGNVWAESTLGKGFEIHFTLPTKKR